MTEPFCLRRSGCRDDSLIPAWTLMRNTQSGILIHRVLILDLTGCQNVCEAIDHFLDQPDQAEVNPEISIRGRRCTIRFTVEGLRTLMGLRQPLKHMAKGLFSDAPEAAMRNLKHQPDEVHGGITRFTVGLEASFARAVTTLGLGEGGRPLPLIFRLSGMRVTSSSRWERHPIWFYCCDETGALVVSVGSGVRPMPRTIWQRLLKVRLTLVSLIRKL
jgi:hypothetical protein